MGYYYFKLLLLSLITNIIEILDLIDNNIKNLIMVNEK